MSPDLADDLDEWLTSVSDRYEVKRTLKSTPSETTEIVWRRAQGPIPSIGPFVRKTFTSSDGRGFAYTDIWRAQARGLRLKNLPLIYECESTGSDLQVVMEHIDGENLQQLMGHTGPSLTLAATVMPGLCDAVSELHESLEHPVIHRDIKPANVIVSGDHVTLIDLGIARQWHEDAARDTERLGTPGYAPPEQYGYGQTDVRSDVFALGMTCAFCLVGELPSPELQESGFRDRRIPKKLAKVLSRACSFDPAARHTSVRALKEDLLRTLPVNDIVYARGTEPFQTVGIVWNTILVTVWLVFFAAIVAASTTTSGPLDNVPVGARAFVYVLFIQVPATFIFYLVADKRRLKRRFKQFSHLKLWQEILGCVIAVVVSVLLSVIIYGLSRQ